MCMIDTTCFNRMFFIPYDNWESLTFIKIHRYPVVWCDQYIAAFFETSVLFISILYKNFISFMSTITCRYQRFKIKFLLRIQWRLVFAVAIRCSRLRLWVGYFVYFKFCVLLMNVFNGCSLIQLNRLRKEINRLLLT